MYTDTGGLCRHCCLLTISFMKSSYELCTLMSSRLEEAVRAMLPNMLGDRQWSPFGYSNAMLALTSSTWARPSKAEQAQWSSARFEQREVLPTFYCRRVLVPLAFAGCRSGQDLPLWSRNQILRMIIHACQPAPRCPQRHRMFSQREADCIVLNGMMWRHRATHFAVRVRNIIPQQDHRSRSISVATRRTDTTQEPFVGSNSCGPVSPRSSMCR